MEDATDDQAMQRARGWILAIGLAYLVLVLLVTIAVGDVAFGDDFRGPLLVLGGIQLGIWWWAAKMPFHATVLALVLFVALNLYQAMVDSEGLRWMILVRVVFLLGLIKAVHVGAIARRHGKLPGAVLVKR